MAKKKLELTWIGKDERHKLEPRILLEDARLSYAARERVSAADRFDNWIIKGDNLLALKALEAEFAGRVKCVYIDPPYNTGSAFAHYDDGVEHSLWLSLMRDRLELLRRLLAEDGSIWISIDANESHYLKVLCDEVFGRPNFVDEVIWQRAFAPISLKKTLSRSHDAILIYSKNITNLYFGRLPRSEEANNRYSNPDNDPRGVWMSDNFSVGPAIQAKLYEITLPSGRTVLPPTGRCWLLTKDRFQEFIDDNRIWFGETGNNVPRVKKFLTEVKDGITPMTLWLRDEVGDNQEAKREVRFFNEQDPFATPKPERLIQRILQLATNPGDLVLDSFAGSGTTGAVAHKMRRRWIMVELGQHAETHVVPRLQKVVDGADAGGVTAATNWTGGGGFRFFRLAPSLIVKDKYGLEIINKDYNPAMLAEAVCKLMNFRYNPSETVYWQMGQSTETDFIYVTTQTLTHAQLAALSEEVGDNRTLLVACAAFRANVAEFPNLTVQKIPAAVLNSCEFGKDDYSLKIANLPQRQEDFEPRNTLKTRKEEKAETNGTPKLF